MSNVTLTAEAPPRGRPDGPRPEGTPSPLPSDLPAGESDSSRLHAGSSWCGFSWCEPLNAEERYQRLVRAAPDAIFLLWPDGRIISLNPAFESITGRRRIDWLGKSVGDLAGEGSAP